MNCPMNCLMDVIPVLDLCRIIGEYAKEIRGVHIWGEILSTSQVSSLTELPEGEFSAGLASGNIWIYHGNFKFGQCLPGHTALVSALIHMSDGTLASGSYDKTVRIWDVATRGPVTCSAILAGHTGIVTSLAELPDGILASGSIDGTIRIWKGAACQVIDTHPVLSLCSLSNGSLAIGSYTSTKFMFGGHAEIQQSGGSFGMVELPSGKLAIRTLWGTICVWNVITGVCEKDLSVEGHMVRALVVLPDGNLAAGYSDECVRIWDSDGICRRTITTGDRLLALAEMTNGRFVSGGYELHVWD